MSGGALSPLQLTTARLLSRFSPSTAWSRYSRLAARAGLTGPRFIFSFDCDTERDIEVVWEVHQKLLARGVTPVYAVPGALLEQGAEVYRRIAETGSEFINHGYAVHTIYHPENSVYESTFFYDQLEAQTVVEDIEKGHRAVSEVIGRAPTGFRAPHFGTIQSPEHLGLVYKTLIRLGYRYSTSTVPAAGMMNGPVYRAGSAPGLWEIPVSGWFDKPLNILDSWSFRFAPGSEGKEARYREQFEKVLAYFSTGKPGLINYYADPSQVHDWDDFFACIEMAAPMAAPSYSGLLDSLESRSE